MSLLDALRPQFIHGRLTRRRLRKPILEGWLVAEDRATCGRRDCFQLVKSDAEGLALPLRGSDRSAPLGQEATALVTSRDGVELLIGWPERILIVRVGSAVLFAEGDVCRHGVLALDLQHELRRIAAPLHAEPGVETRVDLAVVEGEVHRSAHLGTGEREVIGPYTVMSLPSQRSPAQARIPGRPGCFLRIRRDKELPIEPRPPDAPHPLDLERAEEVVALVRESGSLADDEALSAEPAVFDNLMERYEGPRQALRHAAHEFGPVHPTLIRSGESVVVESARLFRGEHGRAFLGAATIVLLPTGELRLTHGDAKEMPGRLRRTASGARRG